MKAIHAIIPLLLSASLASGSDTPRSAPPVLALAPADALAVVYLARPADLLEHPFWAATGATSDPVAGELLRATAATFNGPIMIAVCGVPPNPATLRIEFATQPANGGEAFFKQLGETCWPAIAKAAQDPTAGIQASGALQAIRLPGAIPITIFAAEKNGMIYGSSRRDDVTAWLEGQELTARFTSGDDAAKLADDMLMRSDMLAYVNVRPLMPLLGMEMERALPGIYASLGLDRLEFGAVMIEWSLGRVGLQASLNWADGDAGILDLLAPLNAPLEISALVPSDYNYFVRGAWASAADWQDSVNSIIGTIDAEIVEEFKQECAEFRAEHGFDPLEDLAANLVDEWMVAGRLDASGSNSTLAAMRLANPAIFQAQAQKLISAYALETETRACGDSLVYSAPAATRVNVAWAIIGDYLVLSNQVDPVCSVATEQAAPRESAGARALRDVMRLLPAESSRMAFVDVSALARLALSHAAGELGIADMVAGLKRLAEASAGAGLTISREDNVVNVRLAASDAVSAEIRQVAWKSLAASVVQSREMAKRAVSSANLRGIVQGCLIYAANHKNAWPASFAELLQEGDVLPAVFRAPYDESTVEITPANVDQVSSYLYRNGTGLPPTEVVACEKALQNGGANFAFADGHVEWITGARAEELIAQMARSAGQ